MALQLHVTCPTSLLIVNMNTKWANRAKAPGIALLKRCFARA